MHFLEFFVFLLLLPQIYCSLRIWFFFKFLEERMKLSWPLSTREAVVHYFLFEYFQDDLIVVLLNTVALAIFHGFDFWLRCNVFFVHMPEIQAISRFRSEVKVFFYNFASRSLIQKTLTWPLMVLPVRQSLKKRMLLGLMW